MKATLEAEVDATGNIKLKDPVTLRPGSRVLVTVVEDAPPETAVLSEASLAADWNRPEEDAAWAAFGQAQ